MQKRKRGSTNSEPFVRNVRRTAEKIGVDLDALHAYLWRNTERTGRLLLSQSKVGEELDLYPMLMSRVFRALEQEGRIRKEGHSRVFVVDPEVWRWSGASGSSAS
jgi:hypothetical protein